jgi:hypothetical protein
MSSYTVNYEGLEKDEKAIRALKDIDNWINGQKVYVKALDRTLSFQSVLFDAVVYGCSYREYSFTMGFAGVNGYPRLAFWNEVKDSLHTMTQ